MVCFRFLLFLVQSPPHQASEKQKNNQATFLLPPFQSKKATKASNHQPPNLPQTSPQLPPPPPKKKGASKTTPHPPPLPVHCRRGAEDALHLRQPRARGLGAEPHQAVGAPQHRAGASARQNRRIMGAGGAGGAAGREGGLNKGLFALPPPPLPSSPMREASDPLAIGAIGGECG